MHRTEGGEERPHQCWLPALGRTAILSIDSIHTNAGCQQFNQQEFMEDDNVLRVHCVLTLQNRIESESIDSIHEYLS